MIILNKLKFAKNKEELLEHLRNGAGTCAGTYKRNEKGTKLYNLNDELFAYLVHNKRQGYFAVSAFSDACNNGQARYMFDLCDKDKKYLGFEELSMCQEEEIIKESLKSEINKHKKTIKDISL